MVCGSCGAANPDDVKFCGQCGRGFLSADQTQTVLLEASAGAGPTPASRAQHLTGVMSPPPDTTQGATWATPRAPLTPIDFQPGSSFGTRYRIEALLGEGGMGAVYRAYDSELGRTVALKLVRPELATSPQTMQRFKQELLLASKISHKNILRIHDLGDFNGVKFITMAYVEGSDLAGIIEKTGRLPLERALKFAKQLCAALEAAHSEDVVHRDLKPQNILVDQADNAYVSDFGLAKSLEAEATMMTRTGQILGTPRYMSPEQVEAGVIDHRSDLYSLGLIFYEMFTADVPFRGESTLQLMYQRVNERPKDPRTVCPELPEYVANIILKCLEKDPAKRYQHASEILADLEAGRAPELSTPANTTREAPKTISIQIPRRPRGWRLSVIVAVWALAVVAGAWWFVRSRGASQTAAQPTVRHYLAVLPFRVPGDEENTRYVAEGVVDSLSAKLSGLRDVYVASANAVSAAVGKQEPDKLDPAKISHTLGVTMLVRGTVQSAADKVSITISLDETGKNPRTLLHKEFAGLRGDVLTLEDNAFESLVSALAIQRTNDELARGSMKPTENSGAYELYLKGRTLLRQAKTPQDFENVAKVFDQATQADARFALAYTGLADTYLQLWNKTKDSVWAQRASGAAQQAQALNDSLPEVHFALGSIDAGTGKPAEAIAELSRALELAPNSDEALRRLGAAYFAAERKKEAIDAYTKATEVNPYFWTNFNALGAAYLRMGQYDQALERFRKVIELEPDRASGYANVGTVYLREGRWNEAIPMLQKAIALQPSANYYSNLGYVYYFQEHYADAVAQFAEAVKLAPNDATYQGNLADAYRWSGQKDKARAAYDQAIKLAFENRRVNPKNPAILGQLAIFYAKQMDDARATQFIRDARQIDPKANDLMYAEAIVHAVGGRASEALASLDEALKNGYAWREAAIDPELKTLRGRPEYRTLEQKYSTTSRN
jgi:eukaryotic-like serine/threonine-protein kinase